MIKRNFIISTSDTSLTTADQSLDGQDISRIEVTFLLLGKEGLDFLIFIRDDAVFSVCKKLVETIDKVHESCYFLITHSNVS